MNKSEINTLCRVAETSKNEKEVLEAMEKLRAINPTYHFCPDWDYMVFCDKDPEASGCNCKKPITEEWLLSLGFTEISDDVVGRFGNAHEKHRIFSLTRKTHEGFNVHFIKSDYGGMDHFEIVAKWDGNSLRGGLEYQHQLKLLYRALTDEELNVHP